jgi:hypothetical protein
LLKRLAAALHRLPEWTRFVAASLGGVSGGDPLDFLGELRLSIAGLSHLRQRIRGQDHVIARIASLLQRGELGLRKPGRPRGSFLFLGPSRRLAIVSSFVWSERLICLPLTLTRA